MEEFNVLIDELVSKRGPTVEYIKKDQDPEKVARLLELGYNEPVDAKVIEDSTDVRLARIGAMLEDHENRIHQCSIQR